MLTQFLNIPVRACCAALFCFMNLASSQPGLAQERYPSKSIKVFVPFPPGGSTDIVVRSVLPVMAQKLGQQLYVDNRPGAGGNIGLDLTAKAPNDGYTIGVGAAGGLAANVSLYRNLPYDPVKDFTPIGMIASIPFVIVGHPSLGAKSFSEVLKLAKDKPGNLSVAHGGNGTAMHLTAQLLEQMAEVDLVEIAYKGTGPAAIDVLAGHVPLAVLDVPSALQYIKAGRITAYAVTSRSRLEALPDVPTVAEAGVHGYESLGWFGMVAPAGTPAPVIKQLNEALIAALQTSQAKQEAIATGIELMPGSPSEFGAYIPAEIQKWSQVIRKSGTRLD